MDNCWGCFGGSEAEEAYALEKNRAMYMTGHSVPAGRVEQSTILARSLSQQLPVGGGRPLEGREGEGVKRAQVERVEAVKVRNLQLRRYVESRRVELWGRVDELQRRSDYLRATYAMREGELRVLVGEIDRRFK
jgi:hypothetical protein